ncbi:redox-regulated ATPase YchF [Candidatus Uhrbacteria bacterium]|nr:redox-regulated ATPase YchF [Candidatus Uhrbacteria bacterium]
MSLKIGIVGLPNVGKSTLFKALTKKQIDIDNYPFCTIDPNVGVVEVPDDRLQKLAAVSTSEKIIPTTIEFVDIAGLVKGAHEGEGLGNKFLANIREVDAIAHVVREFNDPNIIHVHNRVDPTNDQEVINLELIFADLATVNKRLEGLSGKARSGDKEAQTLLAVLEKTKLALEQGNLASTVAPILQLPEEKKAFKHLQLLTSKPQLIVVNVDESKANDPSSWLDHDLTDAGQGQHDNVGRVAISAKLEAELMELADQDRMSMMNELGLARSGLDRLILASYRLLHLLTYFTSGPMETRAWTITEGTKAPQAAGVIHTDFERGFIAAEVIGWKDLVELGGEAAAKEKGTLRLEGKEYIVQDGDVMHFRFAT